MLLLSLAISVKPKLILSWDGCVGARKTLKNAGLLLWGIGNADVKTPLSYSFVCSPSPVCTDLRCTLSFRQPGVPMPHPPVCLAALRWVAGFHVCNGCPHLRFSWRCFLNGFPDRSRRFSRGWLGQGLFTRPGLYAQTVRGTSNDFLPTLLCVCMTLNSIALSPRVAAIKQTKHHMAARLAMLLLSGAASTNKQTKSPRTNAHGTSEQDAWVPMKYQWRESAPRTTTHSLQEWAGDGMLTCQ